MSLPEPRPAAWRGAARARAGARGRGDRRGVAALEFALLSPILLLMMLGTADVVDFLRVSLRLERTAGEVTNVVAQYEALKPADMTTIFDLAQRIAGSFDVTSKSGAVIITGVANTGSGAGCLWRSRAGSSAFSSALKMQGTRVSVGDNVGDASLSAGQGAVVTEVFLPRAPWFFSNGLWGAFGQSGASPFQRLTAFAMQRPRLTGVLRLEGATGC